jgi:hypothetical protein
MKLNLNFGNLKATKFNCTLFFGGWRWGGDWGGIFGYLLIVSVESVASIFRLEKVVLGFSEMLIPFKLPDVTAQKTVKLKLLKIIGR